MNPFTLMRRLTEDMGSHVYGRGEQNYDMELGAACRFVSPT